MTMMRRTLSLLASLILASCGGGGGGSTVDPVAAAATAGCETAAATQLAVGDNMLPGRACNNCHKAGGQAAEADARWTVAGTVFGSPTSMCNSGGVAGAKVEILDKDGKVQVTLTTTSSGNFFTTQAVTFPVRARVSKDGKTQEMFGPRMSGNCASCHQIPAVQGAPGRIYLN